MALPTNRNTRIFGADANANNTPTMFTYNDNHVRFRTPTPPTSNGISQGRMKSPSNISNLGIRKEPTFKSAALDEGPWTIDEQTDFMRDDHAFAYLANHILDRVDFCGGSIFDEGKVSEAIGGMTYSMQESFAAAVQYRVSLLPTYAEPSETDVQTLTRKVELVCMKAGLLKPVDPLVSNGNTEFTGGFSQTSFSSIPNRPTSLRSNLKANSVRFGKNVGVTQSPPAQLSRILDSRLNHPPDPKQNADYNGKREPLLNDAMRQRKDYHHIQMETNHHPGQDKNESIMLHRPATLDTRTEYEKQEEMNNLEMKKLEISTRKCALAYNEAAVVQQNSRVRQHLMNELKHATDVLEKTRSLEITTMYTHHVTDLEKGIEKWNIAPETTSHTTKIPLMERPLHETESNQTVSAPMNYQQGGQNLQQVTERWPNVAIASPQESSTHMTGVSRTAYIDNPMMNQNMSPMNNMENNMVTPPDINTQAQAMNPKEQDNLEEQSTVNIMNVKSPADLPEGYIFEVKLGEKKFKVTVPKGGVKTDQIFQAAVRSKNKKPPNGNPNGTNNAVTHGNIKSTNEINYSVEQRNIPNSPSQLPNSPSHLPTSPSYLPTSPSQQTVQMDIPMGRWRDSMCDCLKDGFDHPMLLNSCFVPFVALAQVMTRMRLDSFGNRYTNAKKLPVKFVFLLQGSLLLLHGIVIYFLLNVDNMTEFLILTVSMAGLDISLLLYMFTLIVKTRAAVREEYNITQISAFGDTTTAVLCSCCILSQMGRHTADYDTYRAHCCTDTGLPDHVEEVLPSMRARDFQPPPVQKHIVH